MGLFSLYKPREYGYRYIYYDPKKEEIRAKEKQIAAELAGEARQPILKRGVFKEMALKNKNIRVAEMRKSNLRLVIILFLMLAILYFIFQ
ncbi:MAG: hypothetical protein AUK44_07840 [Porphyromonadaceae bacterium CG2_30_38_12]|nr:MAG: hypothetical protein AUK44_07840 [Porphyromonadaceae bacterium CG2_30_38_12]